MVMDGEMYSACLTTAQDWWCGEHQGLVCGGCGGHGYAMEPEGEDGRMVRRDCTLCGGSGELPQDFIGFPGRVGGLRP